MPNSTAQFQALFELQRELQTAVSVTAVSPILTQFIQSFYPDATVQLNHSTVNADENMFSIATTGYALMIEGVAIDEAVYQLMNLVSSVVAQSGVFYTHQAVQNKNGSQSEEIYPDVQDLVYGVVEAMPILKPLDEMLNEFHSRIIKTFSASNCYIALLDEAKEEITFPCNVLQNKPEPVAPISLTDGDSLVAWVIGNNMPFFTPNLEQDSLPVPGIYKDPRPKSIICVPMRVNDEVIGAVSVQSEFANKYSAVHYQAMMAIAAHVAVTIKNASLYTTTRELVEQGSDDYQTAVALRQAIAQISTSLEKDVVIEQLLEVLGHVIFYENAYLFLLDERGLQFVNGRNLDDRPLPWTPEQAAEIGKSNVLLQSVVETETAVNIPNVQEAENWHPYPGSEKTQSCIAIPLRGSGEFLGALMLDSRELAAFDQRTEWLITTIASHAAVAIHNAILFQNSEQQLAELSTLYQASATMTANLDQTFVLQTVVDEMVRALQIDTCSIFVWDNDQQTLVPSAYKSLPHWQKETSSENVQIGLAQLENLEKYPIVRQVMDQQEIGRLRIDNTTSQEEIDLLEAAELKSVMLVPLVQRNNLLGLLALGEMVEPRNYSESQLRLAENLAGQAAVAIEHAHLFTQAQRRVKELSTFHDIVLQLNTPLELSHVLDEITNAALQLMGADNLHIYLYDEKLNEFTFGSALWRDGSRRAAVQKPRATGEGLTATVVKQAAPIVINDAPSHQFFQSEQSRQWGICAIAGFPLKYGDKVIGAFTATYLHPHTFTSEELLLLNLLAEQAAVAVRNAELFADSQRRLRDMSALVDMAKQVTGDLNLESVLHTTVQILQGLMNARASTITMLSEERTELIVKAAVGTETKYSEARMKKENSISGRVVTNSEMVYIRDTYDQPDFLFFDESVRSLCAVPLIVRDEAIGTLTIDSDNPDAFSESDQQLMIIAAAQVSVAIENARLFEESHARTKELADAYEELKESDRLKDELVQNVSHELRTPLTFVKGYVDLLMDGEEGLLSPEQQEFLQIVSDKTDDITRIIDDIITLQRINASNLQLETVPMTDVLNATVASHRLVADKKGLQIKTNYEEDKNALVSIDKGRMNQVLDNLIGNAMKFSPDGGAITITMSKLDYAVCVSISDEGIGMPPEKHKRIFERFYQIDGSARRRFGGTGIGLAIVKRIVDAHNGQIWVESEVDEGSSFFFTLPLVKAV